MNGTGKGIYLFLLPVILLIFAALKIPAISLPYFWDELGVYTRSSYYLAQHGLGLLPAQLPPELSRGHPLLFSFIYGIAFKLFGPNIYAGHVLSLLIAILVLASIYYMVKKVSHPLPALLCVCLLAAQPLFFAQSVLVLPEMLIALFALWALYAFYRQHFLLFAAFACAAILVKESAITIPAAALVWGMLNTLQNYKSNRYLNFKTIALICSPLLIFAGFLLIQKQQNGWYFFPEHAGLISFDTQAVWIKLVTIYNFMFCVQGRNQWLIIFILALFAIILKGKAKIFSSYASLCLVFIAVYVAFCSVNFYMDRYALALMPFLSVLVVISLWQIFKNQYMVSAVVMLLVISSAMQINPGQFDYDADMSYKNVVLAEQQACNYIAANMGAKKTIAATFPMNLVLYCSHTGFGLPNQYNFAEPGPKVDYLIEDSESGPIAMPRQNYTLIKTCKSGFAEVSIWKPNVIK